MFSIVRNGPCSVDRDALLDVLVITIDDELVVVIEYSITATVVFSSHELLFRRAITPG